MLDVIKESIFGQLYHVFILVGSVPILLFLFWLKGRLLAWAKGVFVRSTLQGDQHVQELLVEIRVTADADRVAVYLFHNGEHYVSGNSILRVSAAYESLGNGIAGQLESAQSMLVSTIPQATYFLTVQNLGEYVFFRKVSDVETCFYKAVLSDQGVQAVAKYPIRKNGEIIGYICADFVKTDDPDQTKLAVLKKTAPQLELHINSRSSVFRKALSWFRR